jgi:hypothetical protein
MPETESATNPAKSRARAPKEKWVEFSAVAASSSREGGEVEGGEGAVC